MTGLAELINGAVHIVGYEIAKDPTRMDMSYVRSYFVEHADELADVQAFVEELILKDEMPHSAFGDPGPGAPHEKPASNLSINILNGDNLYLIRLTNSSDSFSYDSQAKWGPASPPIGFMPENIYGASKPLRHVRLLYADEKGIKAIPENAIPARLDDIPENAWLCFRCDIDAMRKLWSDIGYGAGIPFLIPFRFNLFDRVHKTPVWNVGHSHHAAVDADHDASHDADGGGMAKPGMMQTFTHGGIHPGNNPQLMTHGGIHPGNPHLMTHGGIHPDRDRTHGGIHPGSLVEYFYPE